MEPATNQGCPDFQRLSRRRLFQVGALGALGLSLPEFLRRMARADSQATPSASHAIFIFLGGGPSHHDTFDPKPEAPADIRGEFAAIETELPGVRYSAELPLLARQMHRTAILRSVTHNQGAHEPGVAYMMTGYSFRPGHNFPGPGAVVAVERKEQSRVTGLPAYLGIPNGRGGGHLGPSYNPLAIPGDPNDPTFRVQDVTLWEGVSEPRFRRRERLSAQVNAAFRRTHVADLRQAADKFTEQAYNLVTSPQAQAAFDLNREDPRVRDRYGRTQLGQRLLLARRFVEAGVPFITASDYEWDDHIGIFPKMKEKLPVFDRGLSALLEDLDDRGLLQSTVVLVMGEFGRTPKINPNQGRDHWPNTFSVLLAGGGVRGGQVIGASDKEGAYPAERPVTPEELFHSLYVLLGIDPTKKLPSTGGREIQIARDGKFIEELNG